jgi:hypothetical protein
MLLVWPSWVTGTRATSIDHNKSTGRCIDSKANLVAVGYDDGLVVMELGAISSSGATLIPSANLGKSSEGTDNSGIRPSILWPAQEAGQSPAPPLARSALESGEWLEFAWGVGETLAVRRQWGVFVHTGFRSGPRWTVELPVRGERLFSGPLLGVASGSSLRFYLWGARTLVRRPRCDAPLVGVGASSRRHRDLREALRAGVPGGDPGVEGDCGGRVQSSQGCVARGCLLLQRRPGRLRLREGAVRGRRAQPDLRFPVVGYDDLREQLFLCGPNPDSISLPILKTGPTDDA